jgi:hypothetical protein
VDLPSIHQLTSELQRGLCFDSTEGDCDYGSLQDDDHLQPELSASTELLQLELEALDKRWKADAFQRATSDTPLSCDEQLLCFYSE